MDAFVRLRTPTGTLVDLGPGDVIGRLATAQLVLDDPRISEAHAMVSLRGDALQFLALRGRLCVAGAQHSEVTALPGLRLALASGVELEVVDVVLPVSVLALEGPGLPTQVLLGLASVSVGQPNTEVQRRFVPDADAWLWSAGPSWRLQLRGGQPQPVGVGDQFTCAGKEFCLVAAPVQVAAAHATLPDPGGGGAIRLVARYETVHIHRERLPPVQLVGLPARLLSELTSFGAPVSWQMLATQLWNDASDDAQRRHRLDVALSRLRSRLRDSGLRADLVRTSGTGQLELFLHPGDSVVDET